MSPTAQRIALAGVCGWHSFRHVTDLLWGHPKHLKQTSLPTELVPDYLNDLNAMHEVEELLDNPEHDFGDGVRGSLALYDEYASTLSRLFGRSIRATAGQRAEALLRTLGKWEDDK